MIRTILRLITSMTVRARIIVLAAIPVTGFLVNGIAFMVGQYDVERAFHAAARVTDVSEASREFRSSVNAMRARARDFAASPSPDLDPAVRGRARRGAPRARGHRRRRQRAGAAKHRPAEKPARRKRRSIRRTGAKPEGARLHGIGRHPRPDEPRRGGGRTHHPRRHVAADRARRVPAGEFAAEDAATRGGLPAEPRNDDSDRILR